MIQIHGNQSVGADFYLTNSDIVFSGFLSVEIDSDIEIAIDDNSERDEFKFYCVLNFQWEFYGRKVHQEQGKYVHLWTVSTGC